MRGPVPFAASSWLPRTFLALFVGAAAALAWRTGGGADAPGAPPRAETAPGRGRADGESRANASARAGARSGGAYEIQTRLVEALDEARIDVPSLAAAGPYMQAYWRQLRGPWEHPTGAGRALLTTIALRTDAQQETAWTVTTQAGQTWSPDARIWNMNEGSFDQRQAIEAPTPATLVFPVKVRPLARFLYSAAVATPSAAATLFDVVLVDAAHVEHELARTHIEPHEARRWVDEDLDLGDWSGQTVELRLRTSVLRATAASGHAGAPLDDAHANNLPRDAGSAKPAGLPPMSLALWGNPVVVAQAQTRIPYNVLWIVVDALRPDAAASLHDADEDARLLAAPQPPLDALLPAIPGLMPSIDRLAARGVRFNHAWSVASWTRPGTLAMLSGERSSELGIDTTAWVLPTQQITRYYASEPPLLPRILCKNGAMTAAFVNNFFMAGYAGVGLDMGFERVTDHRYRTRDTAEITRDASAWLDGHRGDRFMLFVNYNSPHEPYDPIKELLARVPPAPAGPRDAHVRAYLAEAAKDDGAIGTLLEKLDALNLTRSTLVIVTSDHGETLSAAHDAMGLGQMPMRFHHAVGNFEETTRVPLIMALPGVFDGGRAVSARVRSIDIAPTVLELEGLEADPRMSGGSLLPLARGQKEAEPRVVVTEGRGSRAILWGKWRMIVHDRPPRGAVPSGAPAPAPEPKSPDVEQEPETPDGAEASDDAPDAGGPAAETPKIFRDELYDLDADPGERRNVSRQHPDVMAEMRARLSAAVLDVAAADAAPALASEQPPAMHLRFAGGGRVHRVAGALRVNEVTHGGSLRVRPAGLPAEAFRLAGANLDFAFATSPDALVGFDVLVEPPGAPIRWRLFLDDGPWPAKATFTGPFGLPAVAAADGIESDEARAEVYAGAFPLVDLSRDLGVFVTRDKPERPAGRAGPASEDPRAESGNSEGTKEMERVLEEWGYAHKPGEPKGPP